MIKVIATAKYMSLQRKQARIKAVSYIFLQILHGYELLRTITNKINQEATLECVNGVNKRQERLQPRLCESTRWKHVRSESGSVAQPQCTLALQIGHKVLVECRVKGINAVGKNNTLAVVGGAKLLLPLVQSHPLLDLHLVSHRPKQLQQPIVATHKPKIDTDRIVFQCKSALAAYTQLLNRGDFRSSRGRGVAREHS